MKKRSLVVLLIATLMTSFCFTGCGAGGSGGGKNGSGDAKTIKVKYWQAGLGIDWLNAVIAGFEEKYPEYDVVLDSTSSQTALVASLGYEDIDETDLYLGVKDYNLKGYLEPLDDILESKADGETKTIGEKFSEEYLKLEKASDGHYYNLTYGGGIVGLYYNTKVFEECGITQEPRTTDELVVVCDTLFSEGKKANCHFKNGGYWEGFMADVFFTQYDGVDYVLNNFYGCTDEDGNSPSLKVFTKKDGRYEALRVFEQIITPEYTMSGSNTYDHTTVQTMWLQGEAGFMATGSWITSEMSSVNEIKNINMMRTPVISSIVNKLTTVKTDIELREVVSAIDRVTDGVEEEAKYKKGDNYVVGSTTVSKADWDYIKAARNTVATNNTGNSAFIPKYADEKEGAKAFLKYLYSDEGYKIYTDTLHQTMPLTLDSGELDTSDWSEMEIKQQKIFDTTEQFISQYIAGKHEIFTLGGAYWKNFATVYVTKFNTSSQTDKLTADAAWADSIQYFEDNYEANWLADIK